MQRICGSCNVCCTVMQVAVLNKPAYSPCPSVTKRGCSVYATRSDPCRLWKCLWLTAQLLPEGARPDKSGVILDVIDTGADLRAAGITREQLLSAREAWPGAFSAAPAATLFKLLSTRSLLIVLHAGDHGERRMFLGPKDEVALLNAHIQRKVQERHG